MGARIRRGISRVVSAVRRSEQIQIKNSIPFDTESPMITSGIRLGTPASTTRGFGQKEFVLVGQLISKILKELAKNPENNSKAEDEVKKEVIDLCSSFPIYSSQ